MGLARRRACVPAGYVAYTCPGGVQVDGSLDEPCWAAAPPTDDFVDIVGPTVTPWLRTRAKMLWDAEALYIAADLEDPRLFAHQTNHDRCAAATAVSTYGSNGRGWVGAEEAN